MFNMIRSCNPLFSLQFRLDRYIKYLTSIMDTTANSLPTQGESAKREHVEVIECGEAEQPKTKCAKYDPAQHVSRFSQVTHGKNRFIPKHVVDKMSEHDLEVIEGIKTSCEDLDKIREAIRVRQQYRLTIRLPEDLNCSDYYIENGLRKVYPYPYLFQSYAKRRWVGRKLKDVLKQEFRDISDEQLKARFDGKRCIVNGEPVDFHYVLKDANFITNRTHRHELPVVATPIKIIFEDKDTLVIDKPPSVPIHPCGRFNFNSITNIMAKEYNFQDIRVVHRLDRLVSGVLIFAKNVARAHTLEEMIKNRDVQKEYVCRVEGEFPMGPPEDDGYITVDQPLDSVAGKISIMVCDPSGKESLTKFKRLNYNGKTSAVLCKPKTGRMHQIRVHLQYLGHPIVNDSLYNSDAFGPEKGKGARFGKSLRQLSQDVIACHKASTWMFIDTSDMIDGDAGSQQCDTQVESKTSDPELDNARKEFLSEEERQETMAALGHYFTNESWKDLKEKFKFDPSRLTSDPSCRDCAEKCYDPPLRRLYLYLHAFRYSGTGWSYQSEMPTWAQDTWKY